MTQKLVSWCFNMVGQRGDNPNCFIVANFALLDHFLDQDNSGVGSRNNGSINKQFPDCLNVKYQNPNRIIVHGKEDLPNYKIIGFDLLLQRTHFIKRQVKEDMTNGHHTL